MAQNRNAKSHLQIDPLNYPPDDASPTSDVREIGRRYRFGIICSSTYYV